MDKMIDAICAEIELKQDYLKDTEVETLYFGGGTPSVLKEHHFQKLIGALKGICTLESLKEFTIELNPDDVHEENIAIWKDISVNRISLGIQSFFDEDLEYMNRSHTSAQAYKSVELLNKKGFKNISIDLIYGGHTTSSGMLLTNINEAISLKVPHMSIYGMTVEKKTALHSFIEKGKYPALDDDLLSLQYMLLMETMEEEKYEHYEISNFCKKSKYALHNTNYWKQKSYLGLGPSAHSFNGSERSWNIADNLAYIKAMETGETFNKTEILTDKNKFNEWVMTSLRTKWGCALRLFSDQYAQFEASFRKTMQSHIQGNFAVVENDALVLTKEGKLISDNLISEYFVVN